MATIVLSRYAEKHKSWVFFLTLVWQAKLMPCICRPDIALSIQIDFSLMCSLVYIKNSTKASGITRKLNRSHIDDNGSSDEGQHLSLGQPCIYKCTMYMIYENRICGSIPMI